MNKPIPQVEVRKPFGVVTSNDRFAVICMGSKPLFPNTHGDTKLVTFFTDAEAHKLADSLNEAFANHFDV